MHNYFADVVANTLQFYYNFIEKGYLYAQFDVHGEHAMASYSTPFCDVFNGFVSIVNG